MWYLRSEKLGLLGSPDRRPNVLLRYDMPTTLAATKRGRGVSPYLPRRRTIPMVTVVFRWYFFIQNQNAKMVIVRQTLNWIAEGDTSSTQKRNRLKRWAL